MGRVARGPPSLELLLVLGEAVNLRSLRRNVAGLLIAPRMPAFGVKRTLRGG
jgi:hypothetical protein